MYYIIKTSDLNEIRNTYNVEDNIRLSVDETLCIVHSMNTFNSNHYEYEFFSNISVLDFILHPERINNWEYEYD